MNFDKLAQSVARSAGRPTTFVAAVALVVAWAVSGPLFGFSDTWQLVINTGTTIITFLMVFVIQQSQNKDTLAIQLKLNELIASNAQANNRLVDIEDLSPEELAVLKKFYVKLARLAETDDDVHASHSLDEADGRHQVKLARVDKSRAPRTPVAESPSTVAENAKAATTAKAAARAKDTTRGKSGKPRP